MASPAPGAAPAIATVPAALLRHALAAQEHECQALARALHNEIGQAVSAIKMTSALALDEDDAQQRRQDLQDIIRTADDTVARLRELSQRLRPPQLSTVGLEAALRGELDWRAGGDAPALAFRADPLADTPDEETALAAFRIVQQAVVNALRHAHAGTIEVALADAGDGRFRVAVRDDGDGFDSTAASAPGLALMRERARLCGGHCEIASTPGGGARISAELPYRAPAAQLPGGLA